MVSVKFIDGKGNLFGKVNLIDLVIVIFLALFLYKLVYYFIIPPSTEWVRVEASVCNIGMGGDCIYNFPDWLYENIVVGDVMVDDENNSVAEITDVKLIPYGVNRTVILTLNMKVTSNEKGELFFVEQKSLASQQSLKPNTRLLFESQRIRMLLEVREIEKFTPEFIMESRENLTLKADVCSIGNSGSCESGFPEWLYRNIIVGDYMVDERNVTVANITSIELIPQGEDRRIILTLDTNLIVNDRGDYLFVGRPLKINSQFPFTSKNVNLGLRVLEIEEFETLERETRKVVLLLEDVSPEIALQIKPGLAESDAQGDVIAEVLKKTEQPSRMMVITETGDVFERKHPYNLDLTVTATLKAERIHDDLFYKQNQRVKIGNNIAIVTDRINFQGKIIDIV
ncbi:MAG: DUF4330 family protein, partial [Methanobacteriota archaeon]